MIRSVHIQNLRGIREGRLDKFSPFVVLVGPNNSGKSTVLDAIYISGTRGSPAALNEVVLRRPGVLKPERWALYRENGRACDSATLDVKSDDPGTWRTQVYRSDPRTVGFAASRPMSRQRMNPSHWEGRGRSRPSPPLDCSRRKMIRSRHSR